MQRLQQTTHKEIYKNRVETKMPQNVTHHDYGKHAEFVMQIHILS
jgi:hypothetical protein